MDRKYHAGCIKCGQCGNKLAGKNYFIHCGEPMCAEHRDELTKCFACNNSIQGKVVTALSKRRQFHPEHFNCTKCAKNLCDIPFSEHHELPYCQACWLQSTIQNFQDLVK